MDAFTETQRALARRTLRKDLAQLAAHLQNAEWLADHCKDAVTPRDAAQLAVLATKCADLATEVFSIADEEGVAL